MEFTMLKRNLMMPLMLVAGLLFAASCSDDDPTPEPPEEEDIIDVASGNDQFSTLVAAIQRADLVDDLRAAGPFTVFAPTNQAFTNAGITDVNAVPVEDLRDILLYHVVSGRVLSSQVSTGEVPTLLEGENLNFTVADGTITINDGVGVATADLNASNGVIHVIDGVLMPEEESNTIADIVMGDEDFSTLLAAVLEADLDAALLEQGPFTVFAPTNAAFEAFLADTGMTAEELLASPDLASILSYHVVEGEVPASAVEAGSVTSLSEAPFYVSIDPDDNVWINGNAQVVTTDIEADNGIIHVIDYVITPPTQSIAEIAVGYTNAETPEFTQLVGALTRADLVDAVSGGVDDNLTVFAPTDAAFEALYEALEVDGYEDIPLETLVDVLTYHVVPARAFSQDLREGANLPTLLEGEELTVNLADLEINESGLVPALLNVHATNGVIHVIDQVLVP
ncbi:Uncaracterized surface protein containing fasciclin (FAS1) repeats [Cyclobacterium lianum]|uniref:Uncaracterized surface protein containing fasciclin (FAS1) repeats n=1 Tax=Cyclobacterium lianum TaxID=388280 RepID=A0A1M7JVU2_9BACT|nr:fasciclin domain-containing protein [Cyclobacterium lianum]SHM57031.1 Uncaracterized surface protein containing fasciclin (FAS1) repeats [Cyclobacterium lianum]